MCRVLAVKEGSYFAWRKRGQSRRSRENLALVEPIRRVLAESDQSYGSRRIAKDLSRSGSPINRKRVRSIMRATGLQVHRRRPTPKPFPSSDISVENVLNRGFAVERPNRVWASDITYIPTRQGWLYLAITMDLFSRLLIGWSMDSTRSSQLVIDALNAALDLRQPKVPFVHHSDRGTQYTSADFVRVLAAAGGTGSFSRKGNCWDNAPVESFFATLKRELIGKKIFATRAQARAAIFAYLATWYNRRRIHSTLGYLSPSEFEEKAA